ncbi:DMT family transporter [Maritimibacter sp. UBA3975]|uniref:DMT family transporter n=1 Tax=Maritimibacter sp. UBA3975 TaxID=1946833 RepID=UPI000C0B02E1|nr:DMT family transporter [Maritimibacter sp. UBA3975]MAM61814.1 EamA family transporter [Maritimibacter sp.]
MDQQNNRLGILLMISAVFVFAVQDGVSRLLADKYNVYLIVMIRYWFFALFVTVLAARTAGGLRRAAQTTQPLLQTFRGVVLIVEVIVTIYAFVVLGLIPTHALFASYPLMIAALSGPVLGEKVGPRRWAAIAVGFVGILIILQPGFAVFAPEALIALAAAFLFAVYGLATRYAARRDSAATSFFWTGVTGAIAVTLIGVFYWEPLARPDWLWMGMLCITGALGHFLLIKCYEQAEASAVQPFAYFQLVFVSIIAITFFGESIEWNVALGAVIVVGAGLFTAWRERQRGRKPSAASALR